MDSLDPWTRLLMQVEYMLAKCQRPGARQLFRGHGARRRLMAERLLEQERAALLKVCTQKGLAVLDSERYRPTRAETFCDDLAGDYQTLADTYLQAAEIADESGDADQAKWLRVRADIHAAQSRFLQG